MALRWSLKSILLINMADSTASNNYFTKHLFGAGIECATKLYYKSLDYPENKKAIPFIRHAVFNKRLLKALARTVYPGGLFIDNNSIPVAASQTRDQLNQHDIVLFDAVFEYRRMIARLPIVVRKGNVLTVFQFQTKAFDSRRHSLANKDGRIYDKWRSYLLDFAYQLYLLKQLYPELELQPLLVMPEKSGTSCTDYLPSLLKPLEKDSKPASVSAANQELLVKLEVSNLIRTVWEDASFADKYLPGKNFEKSLFYLRDLYLNSAKEKPEVGLKCKGCEFRIENERVGNGIKSGFNSCWKPKMDTPFPSKHHLFDVIGSGINHWIEQGIYDKRNIDRGNIFSPAFIADQQGKITTKMRQALQLHKAGGRQVPEEIIRPQLLSELQRWQYPLHFLDFEAGNYAVPMRRNRSPYHLLVFQFSCHSLYEDGHWSHHQWIDSLSSGYPNYELVRELIKVPEIDEGTIVQYSNFERHALKRIRRELMDEKDRVQDKDQLIEWIEKIIRRHDSSHKKPPYIADLSRQVKHFYYNCEMESSLSIKDVLRSVMSHSDYLKREYAKPYSSQNFDDIIWWQSDGGGGARNPYSILSETGDFPIRRGTEAMVVYGNLIAQELSTEQRAAYQNALNKYCELDTLAMMMIYEHWKHKMNENV